MPNHNTLSSFRNLHKNEKALLLCNGPSLNKVDFSRIDTTKFKLFGLNKIFLGFEKFNIKPDYLVAVNKKVLGQSAEEYNNLKIVKFISNRVNPQLIPESPYTYYINTAKLPQHAERFSKDICEYVHEGWTVTHAALQIIYYMGFAEVYIIGMDHHFSQHIKGQENRTSYIKDDDNDHFDPKYFGHGQSWDLPDLANSEISYQTALNAFHNDGRSIYDCTINGACQVFPKIPIQLLYIQDEDSTDIDDPFLTKIHQRTDKTIHLPFHEFLPHNKLVSRIKLNLPINKTYLLFGADTGKGGDLLVQTLNIFCENYNVSHVEVLMFGSHELKLPVPVHYVGKINDNTKLSMIYSAANIFVFPSREDDAPLTVEESLACGTPVVSFPVDNTVDIIKHKSNGYLAKYLDVADMAEGINWLIEHLSKQNPYKFQKHCRNSILEHSDPTLSIEKHLSAYNNFIDTDKKMAQQPVCGCFLTYPDTTGKRTAEGGLRIKGNYKHSKGKDNPLVSIVTVCLNSSSTIAQTIQSVLNQSYKNIEYIIVDGGSTDGTIDIIKENEEIIDYYISEPDSSLYNAMNKGLSLASGDYVLILNSDDWYADNCIELLVNAKNYSYSNCISALAQYVDQNGNFVQIIKHAPYDDSIRLRMSLRHETMLIAKEIYNHVGGYSEEYGIISDLHFSIRLFEAGYTLYEIQKPLLFFRNTGISESRNKSTLFSEHEKLVKQQFPFLEKNEISLLSFPNKLKPNEIIELVEKYKDKQTLVKTLHSYFNDRKRINNSKEWRSSAVPYINELNTPFVSVILPIFDSEKTLDRCINSVLMQQLENIELICINDASLDNSQEIIDHYAKKDSRIVSLINKKNIGVGATKNKGIKSSKGSFIFFVDSDDYIPENALELLYQEAVKHQSDVIKGNYKKISYVGDGIDSWKLRPLVNTSLKEMSDLLKTTEDHWSYLYKSELVKNTLYAPDLLAGEDSLFLVKTLVQARNITVLDDIVYYSHITPSLATFNFKKYMDALEWRRRAWHILNDAALNSIGNHLLQSYWSEIFFLSMLDNLSESQVIYFFKKFRMTFIDIGLPLLTENSSIFLKELFSLIAQKQYKKAYSLIDIHHNKFKT